MSKLPHEDFHEIWWIASDTRAELRIAHFRKATNDGTLLVVISDEPPKRTGPRIWTDVAPREGWFKVTQIELPTTAQVAAAREGQPSLSTLDAAIATAARQGQTAALAALATRREANANVERIDNAKLYAGSPMHFYCDSCGADIIAPEVYITRPFHCTDCLALQQLGWIE